MAPDHKERPLPASLPTPSKEKDTTVETLGEMMARLKILEEVQAENKALVQELKEIREERKSEGVPEKPPVFPDDPFAYIKPAHKRTTRKAKYGHGTRTLSRSLRGDFEEEEYYASRGPYKANTGRTGHIEPRSVQEDPFVLEGEFSFLMKEDLERREVAGVSSPNPFMTTSAPNVSKGGAPMQKPLVKEQLEECLGNDAQTFGQNTLMQSPQPTVPIHQFVHTPQLNAQMPVNVPVSVSAVTSGGFVSPVTIGNMPPLVSISSGVPPLQTIPLNTYTYHANPVTSTQTNNALQTETGGRGTDPPLQHLPKIDGTMKGLGTKT
jgi:hypothetical protein